MTLIEELNALVTEFSNKKDILDKTERSIEILRDYCTLESSKVGAAYGELYKFFTANWDKLQGNRLSGGIWKDVYTFGSPWAFEKLHFKRDENGEVTGITIQPNYIGTQRDCVVPSEPSNREAANSVDYWIAQKNVVDYRKQYLNAVITSVRDGLRRLILNQESRFENLKNAVDSVSGPNTEILRIVVAV